MYKTLAEIETRKAAILQEMEQEGADLDALKKEMDELRENAQQLRDAAAKAEETRKAIAEGAKGVVISETRKAEQTSKTVDEILKDPSIEAVLVETDEYEKHVSHKPARLYQLNKSLFSKKNIVNFSTFARIINI